MSPKKITEVRLPLSICENNMERQLLNFFSKVGSPVVNHYCLVQYIKGNLELYSPDFPKKVLLKPATFLDEKTISRNCSKFNIVSSIASSHNNCSYTLSIVDAELDGQVLSNTKVLKMTVTVNDLAAEMALRNLFTLFDEG